VIHHSLPPGRRALDLGGRRRTVLVAIVDENQNDDDDDGRAGKHQAEFPEAGRQNGECDEYCSKNPNQGVAFALFAIQDWHPMAWFTIRASLYRYPAGEYNILVQLPRSEGGSMIAEPKLSLRGVLLLVAVALAGPSGAITSDMGAVPPADPGNAASANQMKARIAYNVGYEEVEAIRNAEKNAASSAGEPNPKTIEAIRQAREKFEEAVRLDPSVAQAWNGIGYTSRRLGEYEKSLDAYEKALALNPSYSEAIEYRAEAYLALNRIDDAKSAYMTLFSQARPVADELMKSMQRWVQERRRKPIGVTKTDVDTFSQWVAEREEVAKQTASLSSDRTIFKSWN
jgi:tetratricopeptide (TPR) repeat protein